MWSETREFPSLEQHIVSKQPTQPLVDQVVEPISNLVDSILLLESDLDIIELMSPLVNPTLPSESEFHKAVESIHFSINPTLPLESEVPTTHIFFATNSEITEQGCTELSSEQPLASSQIASFD